MIDEKDRDVKVDSAYIGDYYKDELLRLFLGINVYVCARAFRNKPLSEEEKACNRLFARVCARVEHVFGYMTRFMAGIGSRVHGLDRVGRDVACKNLAYNLRRYMFLVS